MVDFLSELVLPFSLGPDQVRVGLLQVGTEPHLEFGFDAYSSQRGLQAALERTKQLKGDTNTVHALLMARNQVLKQGVPGGARPDLPRVLVWLTDGVDPGEIREPMARLREEGVAVLVVSTGHGNYQVLREVASPPTEENLFFVDIDDINIISEDLRNAIIGAFHRNISKTALGHGKYIQSITYSPSFHSKSDFCYSVEYIYSILQKQILTTHGLSSSKKGGKKSLLILIIIIIHSICNIFL